MPASPAIPGIPARTPIMKKDLSRNKNWSQGATKQSNALDLESGVFTLADPRTIALSLKRSAESSTRRKSPPFRSAMSMLNFYINRAGSHLPRKQRGILEKAKEELRKIYKRQEKVRIKQEAPL
jgi:hypothetical protein